jgi:hypothetical protein
MFSSFSVPLFSTYRLSTPSSRHAMSLSALTYVLMLLALALDTENTIFNAMSPTGTAKYGKHQLQKDLRNQTHGGAFLLTDSLVAFYAVLVPIL